ncbi:MAG: membrane protein insertion efficiency factor YidD [Deltaproteobacteria bacterium]|nr:membrane protein insertion efficiency factor YidD [Deltaproteobacteria bacterium]
MGAEGGFFPLRASDLLVGALKGYQRAISPLLGDHCRFYPSCSEYMIGSIRKNGCILGVLDGLWRVLRCHPFHPGGVDEPRRIHIF